MTDKERRERLRRIYALLGQLARRRKAAEQENGGETTEKPCPAAGAAQGYCISKGVGGQVALTGEVGDVRPLVDD